MLFKDNIISLFEGILENLIKSNFSSEIIDNIIIEIISILKRPFGDEGMFEKILNSSIIDSMIFLLKKENIIILKLIHMMLITLLNR
jgi:hypothetical protein